MMQSRATPDRFTSIAAAAATGMSLYGLYSFRGFYSDDAFITLRYARNFLEGNGIVWNPGERVEGYTNFLHLILVSAMGRLGLDLVAASRWVGVFSFFGLAAACLAFGSGEARSFAHRYARSVFLVFVLTSWPLVTWAMSGMGSLLFTMLLTLAVMSVLDGTARGSERRILLGAFLFALSALSRPEGFLFAGISLFFTAVRSPGRRVGISLAFSSVFLAGILPHLIWRIHYYGDVFPNTFYVKAHGIASGVFAQGLAYVWRWFTTPPFLLPIALGLGCAAFVRRRKPEVIYLGSMIVIYLLYVISVGGDHMRSFRLIQAVIPLSAILVFVSLSGEPLLGKRLHGRIVLAAAFGLSLMQIKHPALSEKRMDAAAFAGAIIGEYIDATWPPGSTIALNTAGSTPYFAPRHRFIDMLGLNDRHIARRRIENMRLDWQKVPGHAKGDGAYVLSRRPDYIIAGPVNGTAVDEPWFLSDLELAESPEFQRDYRLEKIELDVKYVEGYELFGVTRSGTLEFTYYRRTSTGTSPRPDAHGGES